MPYRETDPPEAWFENLRSEVKGELSSFDGESFGSAVMSRLDNEVENAELALRADAASEDELADAALVEAMPAAIQAALRAEAAQELEAVDFVDFGGELMARLAPPVEADATVQAALQFETEQEISALEPDFANFAAEVMARVDGPVELSESVQSALRSESAEELAALESDFATFGAEVLARVDGPAELSESVQAALRAESAEELADLEFADFGAEVMARVEPPFELAPAIVTALREESTAEIAFLESEWPDFVEEVMVRIDPVPENVTVQAMLRQEVGAELERREGEWNAFTARVFDALDSEERATARLPLEEQAVHQLRETVDGELQEMAPHFEERFGEEVEKQIFKSGVGAQEPGLWDRFTGFMRDLTTPQNYGWAAAMGAAAVLLVVTNIPTATNTVDPLPPIERLQGHVSVEDMSFEGSAIVIPDDGMTIVLLSDES